MKFLLIVTCCLCLLSSIQAKHHHRGDLKDHRKFSAVDEADFDENIKVRKPTLVSDINGNRLVYPPSRRFTLKMMSLKALRKNAPDSKRVMFNNYPSMAKFA